MIELIDVAVDLGQSGSRLALVEHDRPLSATHLPPMSYEADPVGRVLELITDELARVASARQLGTIAVGLTTLLDREEMQSLSSSLRRRTGAERVVVVPDAVIAHAAALSGGPGVVLALGTGSIALAVDSSGSWAQIDGAGFLLGDEGGGYWLGRAGLALALEHLDGRATAPALAARLRDRFGDADTLLALVYRRGGSVAAIAGFCAEVINLADDGDQPAGHLVDEAVRRASRTIEAGIRRLWPDGGTVPFSVVGGLSRSPLFVGLLRHAVEERTGATWVPSSGDGLAGAALLATAGAERCLTQAVRELGARA